MHTEHNAQQGVIATPPPSFTTSRVVVAEVTGRGFHILQAVAVLPVRPHLTLRYCTLDNIARANNVLDSECFRVSCRAWCWCRHLQCAPCAPVPSTYITGRQALTLLFRVPHSVCPVFTVRDRLAVSPTGSGGYMVFPQQDSFQSNRVNLRWGESSDHHVYDCSCRWCLRWKMPCRHVLAAAKG